MGSIRTQDLYKAVVTEVSGIASSGDVNFTVSTPPSRTNGFLVLSPDNALNRETVYFHNVIGSRIYVRGVNRKNPKAHSLNDLIQMNDVEEIFNYYADMTSPLFYVEKTGSLNVLVWGGTVLVNRTQVTVADTALTLTDNTTNYIVYDYLTNVISVNTTGVGLVKATVVTASGIITSITYNIIKESYADPYVPDLALVAPEVQKQTWVYAAATGAVNTYAITLTPAPTAYATGQKFTFKANLANTGTATLNVNGLGAKTIKKLGGTTNLASGDIAINHMVEVEYNGTDFDMQSPVASVFQLDIHGQTQKTTPIGADELLIGDSEASFANKKITISSMIPVGNGSDGALSISSGTTTIPFDATGYVEKNYTSFTMTGGTLNFSGPTNNGGIAVIKVLGNFSMTGSSILDISGMGGAGVAATSGIQGKSIVAIPTTNFGVGSGASFGSSSGTAGAGGASLTEGSYFRGWCGAGGGSGGQGNGGSGVGGRGGGLLIIEVGGIFTFNAPAIIRANGISGTVTGTDSAGNGGGGGGSILIRKRGIGAYTGTIEVNGGAGTAGTTVNYTMAGGGGGAGYSAGGAGGAIGVAGTAGTSNSFGTGGPGGGVTPTKGGGGGGGAGFYYVN